MPSLPNSSSTPSNRRQSPRHISLRSYLTFAFLLNTFLVTSVLTLTYYLTTSRALEEEVSEDLQEVAHLKATTIASFLTRRVSILQVFALDRTFPAQENPATSTALARLDTAWRAAEDTDPLVRGALEHPLVQDMAHLRRLFPEFVELFITDHQGALVAALDRPSDYLQADEGWWQAAMSEGQGAVYIGMPTYDESSQLLGIVVAVPLYSPDQRDVLGILRATIDSRILQRLLAVQEASEVGWATLLFPDQTVLTSEHAQLQPAHAQATTLSVRAPIIPITGEPFVTELGWILIFNANEEEALAATTEQTQRALLLAALLAVAITLAAIRFCQNLTTPLHHLIELIRELSAGNLAVRTAIHTNLREVHHLAHSFDQMAEKLAERQAARQVAERELEEERALLARRVAEQTADLSLANAELMRAARAKDEFLASMSHELRTPLNAILNLTESLSEGVYGELTVSQQDGLLIITESGRHLLSLINDILDLSKIEAGQFQLNLDSVNVPELCEMSLRLVRAQALQKRLSLQVEVDPQVTLIVADNRRLKQILVNLLGNAVKFTLEGGIVGLEVNGEPNHQLIRMTVWDTGIGIAQEDLARLFQPFVQLDSRLSREYTGTGLGLALVRRLVELHGGSIHVTSAPEEGSRFTVSLPWILPPHLAFPDEGILEGVLRWGPERALVIEDSPSTAEQLVRYLQEWGARAVVHPQGEGAVRQALALRPDVILLDLLLPDQSGWDVLARLKADTRTQDIPVVIVSVVDEVAEGLQRGAAAYLVKPIVRADLQRAFQQTLPGRLPPPTILAVLPSAPEPAQPLIMVVDDSLITRQILADYLATHGYRVATAESGTSALEQAVVHPPDLILMDIQMPGLDGLETMRRLRLQAGLAHTPIIALTALAMSGDREQCLAAGANDYLTKPVGLKVLRETIQRHLRKEPAMV